MITPVQVLSILVFWGASACLLYSALTISMWSATASSSQWKEAALAFLDRLITSLCPYISLHVNSAPVITPIQVHPTTLVFSVRERKPQEPRPRFWESIYMLLLTTDVIFLCFNKFPDFSDDVSQVTSNLHRRGFLWDWRTALWKSSCTPSVFHDLKKHTMWSGLVCLEPWPPLGTHFVCFYCCTR